MMFESMILFFAFLTIIFMTLRKSTLHRSKVEEEELAASQKERENEQKLLEDASRDGQAETEQKTTFTNSHAASKKDAFEIKEEDSARIVHYVHSLPKLRNMVIYQEILGPPIALRKDHDLEIPI